MPLLDPLRRAFFERDPRLVGRELVGCRLVRRLADGTRLVLRLVEVESYGGQGEDIASHAFRGQTPRNRSMFGPAGRLYAYRSYGMHTCLNVVAHRPGEAGAVLLRAAEPLEGLAHLRAHRGLAADASDRLVSRGPGRLAGALALGVEADGTSLLRGALTLHPPEAAAAGGRIEVGPRVGISLARDAPDRFFEAESPWVSPYRPGRRTRDEGARETKALAEAETHRRRRSARAARG